MAAIVGSATLSGTNIGNKSFEFSNLLDYSVIFTNDFSGATVGNSGTSDMSGSARKTGRIAHISLAIPYSEQAPELFGLCYDDNYVSELEIAFGPINWTTNKAEVCFMHHFRLAYLKEVEIIPYEVELPKFNHTSIMAIDMEFIARATYTWFWDTTHADDRSANFVAEFDTTTGKEELPPVNK